MYIVQYINMEDNINFLIYKENIVDLHNLILNYNICWLIGNSN